MDWNALGLKVGSGLATAALIVCYRKGLPRMKEAIMRGYYRRCYPGSVLLRIRCWFRHPISTRKRVEAEFSAGWKWPDPWLG